MKMTKEEVHYQEVMSCLDCVNCSVTPFCNIIGWKKETQICPTTPKGVPFGDQEGQWRMKVDEEHICDRFKKEVIHEDSEKK